MRHHFGDFLDRDDDYWTIVPNRERYAYRIGDVPCGSKEVTIVTIGRDDEHWRRVLTLPNLVELTLHEPSQEQLQTLSEMHSIQRLRLTHARPKTIEFIESMSSIEELVLEYVSGFTDLSPLRKLKRLRALHMENLRRVSNFGGLAGLDNLQYLAIYGTLDWKQPIDEFDFLRGLPKLEVLAFFQVITKKNYPAMLPALSLNSLKKLKLHRSYLASEEYALMEEGFKGVNGADWGPFEVIAYKKLPLPAHDIRTQLPDEIIRTNHPEVMIDYKGNRTIDDPDSRWYEFTGKRAGRVKCTAKNAEAKCSDFVKRYEIMKKTAKNLINGEPRGTS